MAIMRIHDLLNLMVWIFCRAAYNDTPDSYSSWALAAVPAPQLHMYLSPSRNSLACTAAAPPAREQAISIIPTVRICIPT
jgi:hypothetical protein